MGEILDAKGQKIVARKVPIIAWKGFCISMRTITNQDMVQPKTSVSPEAVIRELRASHLDMTDRFNFLLVGLSTLAEKDPKGDLALFLNAAGLVLKDYDGKVIYDATKESPPLESVSSAQI